DIERAISYTHRAARQATALCAYDQAVVHWRRALEALASAPAEHLEALEERRCELLIELGEALNTAAKRRERMEVFQQAAEIARRRGAVEVLARAALGCGGDWQGMSEVAKVDSSPGAVLDDTLARLLREALNALGSRNDALRARLCSRLAVETYFTA